MVLLSTYNGAKYLREQLDSILKQTNVNVQIIVRDDGSSDATLEILKEYKQAGRIHYYSGENKRTAQSFMDLVYNSPDSDYYAFCDQDDYWLPDKLIIGMEAIKAEKEDDMPLLYYGMPRIVDEKLKDIYANPPICETMTTYNSCLVNSKATGCTMVFNRKLCNLLKSSRPDYILMHDAWAHKVCLAMDGKVIFDPDVHILYRQHGGNVVGVPKNFIGKMKLYYREFQKDDQMRSRCIQSLLDSYGDRMSTEKRKKAEIVAAYKNSFGSKMKLFFNREIRTDYWKRNLLYKLAVLFGKF